MSGNDEPCGAAVARWGIRVLRSFDRMPFPPPGPGQAQGQHWPRSRFLLDLRPRVPPRASTHGPGNRRLDVKVRHSSSFLLLTK